MSYKALVVGGAGYVGSMLTANLLERGYHVMVFDDLSSGSLSRLPVNNENLIVRQGSIVEPGPIAEAVRSFEPDLVFHLAAVHYIPQCIANPGLAIDVNVKGTLHVVEALNQLENKPRLVFTSSASVYGAVTPAPQRVIDTPQPCDIYGYTKLVGEHLVSSRYDNYVIARLFNVFGNSDPIPHLIPSVVRQLDNETVALGNPNSERDFIHVQDAARGFVALGEQGKHQATYNIGSGINYSVKEVTDALSELSGSQAKFEFQVTELRKADPNALCADITEITADTDWRPRINFRQGLQTVLDSRKAAGNTPGSRQLPDTQNQPVQFRDYVAVISDFDDTILDNGDAASGGMHEQARLEALREVGQARGIDFLDTITPEMTRNAIINAPVHVSEGAFWWLLTEAGYIDKSLAFDPEHELIQTLSEAKLAHYKRLLAEQAKEVPGAQAFFQAWHDNGYAGRLGIASSGRREEILTFFAAHGFGHLFDQQYIIAREDTEKLKPNPEAFLLALKAMGIAPHDAARVLVFEDDPKGIAAAKQAGLTVCAITTRFSRAQLLSQPVSPDFIADSFDELMDLFGLRDRTGLLQPSLA
jgi:UDP-glucose 4-epimerase